MRYWVSRFERSLENCANGEKLTAANFTKSSKYMEVNMAHVVTLDMDELAGDLSPGLLADMQEARCETQDSPLADPHFKAGSGLGPNWRRANFRQHAQGVFDGVVFDGQSSLAPLNTVGVSRHWLLRTVYGRDVLKAYLAKVQPDLQVSKWRMQPELDGWLQDAVVALGLWDMQEPQTFRTRLTYLIQMSRVMFEFENHGRVFRPANYGSQVPLLTASMQSG